MGFTVEDYANQLNISPRRVRAQIQDGQIRARKIGNTWQILDPPPVVQKVRLPGPKLSTRSFDQLAEYLDLRGKVLNPQERFRSSQRASHIVNGGLPVALAYADRNGVNVSYYSAENEDLEHLRRDSRILLTGVSHPSSAIATQTVDGYVAQEQFQALTDMYFLEEVPRGENNVTLRKANSVPVRLGRLHILTDLAGDTSSRSVDAAERILDEIREDLPYA
ncbi:hypothetical protein CGLAUT_09500 [Corynebacterium glaucum]|nr:hypothetical protein CGLAUT_09500 [Corynebacterium glaucum]